MGTLCTERRPRGFLGQQISDFFFKKGSPSAEVQEQQQKVLLGRYVNTRAKTRAVVLRNSVPCFLRAWLAYS